MRKTRQIQDYLIAAIHLFPSLSIPRLLVLHEVYLRGEVDQATLVDRCGFNGSRLSKTVASLTELASDKTEGLGFINSTPDPMNLKSRILRMTPKGQEAVEMIFQAAWL